MGPGFLATMLDQEMIEVKHTVAVYPRNTLDASLPERSGLEVSEEIGHRYLIRYLLQDQVGRFTRGSSDPHFVTPTPYSRDDLTRYLALPNPRRRRSYALILDPERIDIIKGPRWVRGGSGIEYLLPRGFTPDAIAFRNVGPLWEIQIW